jgi:hypothetical protein
MATAKEKGSLLPPFPVRAKPAAGKSPQGARERKVRYIRAIDAPEPEESTAEEARSGGIRSSELDVRRHHRSADQEQGRQSQRATPTPMNNLERPQVVGFWLDEDADDYHGNQPDRNQRETPPQTSPAIQRPRGRDQEPENEREGSNHKHIRRH